LFEIQEGLGQLFNSKRNAKAEETRPDIVADVNIENPFLRGRQIVEFDSDGWVPLFRQT
jgi:hypothetical protein